MVETGKIAGYISAISFNNLFYVAQKTAGTEQAIKAVRQLRQIFRIVPLDEVIIDLAIEAPGHDFEDAIQAASAFSVQAQYIISRNEKDFTSFSVPALTAEAFLALLKL